VSGHNAPSISESLWPPTACAGRGGEGRVGHWCQQACDAHGLRLLAAESKVPRAGRGLDGHFLDFADVGALVLRQIGSDCCSVPKTAGGGGGGRGGRGHGWWRRR
jgi:hypothetical protein